METVITIGAESVTYADRLQRLLLDDFEVDVREDDALDPVSLLPAFVLSGASIRTDAHAHGEHVHVVGIVVEVPEALLDAFYATLPQVLVADDDDFEDDEAED